MAQRPSRPILRLERPVNSMKKLRRFRDPTAQWAVERRAPRSGAQALGAERGMGGDSVMKKLEEVLQDWEAVGLKSMLSSPR